MCKNAHQKTFFLPSKYLRRLVTHSMEKELRKVYKRGEKETKYQSQNQTKNITL